jgi:hypothetical protein
MFYPAFIDLENRPVLVVGGGVVAERKVEALLETGALVTVVSPETTQPLQDYAQAKRITIRLRGFIPSDVDVSCRHSGTDDPITELKLVHRRTKNILVNTDKPEPAPSTPSHSSPRRYHGRDIHLRKSPSLAPSFLRLDRVLTEEFARTATVLGAVRQEVHQHFSNSDDRKRVFDSIIGSGIVEWIAGHDDAAALERVRQMIQEMIEKTS